MVESLRPQGQEAENIDSFDKALRRIADLEVEGQRLYRLLHKFLMLRKEIRQAQLPLRVRDDRLIAELEDLFASKPLAHIPEQAESGAEETPAAE